MVARAAYRSDHLRRDFLIRDELSVSVDKVDEDNAGSATAPRDTPDRSTD